MNNQQTSDPSLVSIQNEIIGEDSNEISKSSIKESVILIFLCLILTGVFLFIYIKWMSIPVKKHFIQVEYLASSKESANIRASVEFYAYKGFDIDTALHLNNNSQQIKNLHNIKYGFCFDGKANVAKPRITFPSQSFFYFDDEAYDDKLRKQQNKESISDIIQPELYMELEDFCQNHDFDISSMDSPEIFYLRYFDNEKPKLKLRHNITIRNDTVPILNTVMHSICFTRTNDFTLSTLSRDSSLRIIPHNFNERISKKSLSKQGYRNNNESFILTDFSGYPYGATINLGATIEVQDGMKFLKSTRLWKLIQMEDISQSYYIIDLYTHSIPDMSLRINFFGTIDCKPDISIIDKRYNYSEYYEKSCIFNDSIFNTDKEAIAKDFLHIAYPGNTNRDSTRYYFDRNSLIIRANQSTKLKCLVKYDDMENIQTMRLFILAAFFTLTLTTMIKSIWKIRKVIFLGITKNSKSLWKKTVAGTTKFKKKMIRSRKKLPNQSPSE